MNRFRPIQPRHALGHALLLSLALSSAGALAQGDPAKAARFYEDALKRFEKQDLAGTIIQLKNALQVDKNQLPVHVLLGRALLANSEPGAAEVEFGEALRLGVNRAEVVVPLAQALIAQGKQPQVLDDPRLKPAGLPPAIQQRLLLQRALAASDMGDAKQALALVQDARAINPSEVDAWTAEVPLRVRARQFTEANAAADAAVKLGPDNAEALYQKGSVLHASNQIQQAMSWYERALKANAGHAESRLARAGILLDLKRDADAQTELKELQLIAPRDPRAVYLRALLSERAGDSAGTKAALKTITELLDPVPLDFIRFRTQMLMLNGLAHFGLGEQEKAKPYLELAGKQQPNTPLVKLLAQIALSEPNLNKAVELLDGYVKAQPGDGQALLMLASANMGLGRHARATALMEEALKAKDSAEYRSALGLSLLQSGRSLTAAQELEKAYKADPKQTYAGLALVTIHLQQRNFAKALSVADNLLKTSPSNATVQLVQAYAKAEAGDLAGARAGYEKTLKLDPKLTVPKLGLARLDAAGKDYEAANKRLRELLRGDDRNVDILFELAMLHEQWGKDAEALKWLESAADASSQRETRANFALIAWQLRKGTPAKAMDAAKILLAKLPENVEALQAYASAQVANGDIPGAKTSLTNAARRAAFEAPVLVEIARHQVVIKDVGGAAYSVDKALTASPDFLPAQALMASIELMQGDPAKSEKRARQILQANPKSALGHNLLADVALNRGQVAAALESLKQAHALEKSSNTLLRLIGTMASQSGGKPSIELAEAWLKQHPDDVAVRKAEAELQVRAGNYAAAKRQYETVLKQRPTDLDSQNNLANVMLQAQDPGALSFAEKALAQMPHEAILLDTAGWANHIAGNRDRALQLLRDARLRSPNNPEIRYHLGVVLAKAGRNAEAKEELAAALRNGNTFQTAEEAKKLLLSLN